MAARFRLRDDGREFPALSALDLELGEVIDLERLLGVGMDAWSSAMEMAALVFASAERAAAGVSWEQVRRFKPGDVIRVGSDDEDDAGPPDGAGDVPATPTATPTS